MTTIDPKDLEAKSDQMNAVDILTPTIFRIVKVDYFPRQSQCMHLHLHGCEGRPYKPCKGMLRGLAKAWPGEIENWNNHLIELFCEDSVLYAGKEVGGLQVSAVSGVQGDVQFPLTISRTKRVIHTFRALSDDQPVIKEFIKTHHESNINEAKTGAEIDKIVQTVKNEFGLDSLMELKDTVTKARAKLAENTAPVDSAPEQAPAE